MPAMESGARDGSIGVKCIDATAELIHGVRPYEFSVHEYMYLSDG
jgi:hypothetical protein